jgi:type I restriction enzyme S subunit
MNSGEVNNRTITLTEKLITQEAFESCSTKMVPAGSVVVALAGQGKTRGKVARILNPICTNQSLSSIVPDQTILDFNFLFFYLETQYQNLRSISSGDGTRGGLNLQMIRDFKVPLPPLGVQVKIASQLEHFDSLSNDIYAGLLAELLARRKQYEHYRDKLLTFKEAT